MSLRSTAGCPPTNDERIVWEAYPSWAQFTWLYLLSAMALIRGVLGVGGWDMWLAGAVVLFGCAAAVRRWAHYSVSSRRIVVANGYTAREIQAIAMDEIGEITVKQGPIARLFGIGTLAIRAFSRDRVMALSGISNPEALKSRIDALRPKGNMKVTQRTAPP